MATPRVPSLRTICGQKLREKWSQELVDACEPFVAREEMLEEELNAELRQLMGEEDDAAGVIGDKEYTLHTQRRSLSSEAEVRELESLVRRQRDLLRQLDKTFDVLGAGNKSTRKQMLKEHEERANKATKEVNALWKAAKRKRKRKMDALDRECVELCREKDAVRARFKSRRAALRRGYDIEKHKIERQRTSAARKTVSAADKLKTMPFVAPSSMDPATARICSAPTCGCNIFDSADPERLMCSSRGCAVTKYECGCRLGFCAWCGKAACVRHLKEHHGKNCRNKNQRCGYKATFEDLSPLSVVMGRDMPMEQCCGCVVDGPDVRCVDCGVKLCPDCTYDMDGDVLCRVCCEDEYMAYDEDYHIF